MNSLTVGLWIVISFTFFASGFDAVFRTSEKALT
jgi:hypothetical protein